MPQLVHVIAPAGDHFEHEFPDRATPEQILAALRRPDVSRLMGYAATEVKRDRVFGQDVPHPAGPLVMDHPDTVIAVGRRPSPGDDTGFVETARLMGPPPKE